MAFLEVGPQLPHSLGDKTLIILNDNITEEWLQVFQEDFSGV